MMKALANPLTNLDLLGIIYNKCHTQRQTNDDKIIKNITHYFIQSKVPPGRQKPYRGEGTRNRVTRVLCFFSIITSQFRRPI